VEQAAVLRHLEVQRHYATPRDGPVIDAFYTKVFGSTTVVIGRVECFTVLRNLRAQRERLGADMRALEERRLRGGFDGELDAAHRALDADCMILDDVIRRVWDICM
jgi:hypothetical protein